MVATFCGALFPALAANTLSPEQIKSTFGTGQPFSSISPSGAAYTLVLNVDGSASRTPKGSKAAVTGTWRVASDGYCSKWGKNPENCYTIQKGAKAYTVLDSGGKIVARWRK
jgi:hypothetical protein